MIPRFTPYYNTTAILKLLTPAKKGAVKKLEKEFSVITGHSEAIAFRYGRSGLYYLLKSMGARNKKVILPAYTCVVVANAIVESGNIPVFLDNIQGGFQPDPLDYYNAIDDNTVMIIPTHIFGIAQETAELYNKVKKDHPHIFVLQDCAHSYFCQDLTGKIVTEYGDGAIFGMNISKLVNSIKGGMLTLRNKALADKIRKELATDQKKHKPNIIGPLKARLYALAAHIAFTSWGFEIVRFLKRKTRILDSETKYYNEDNTNLPTDYSGYMYDIEAEIGLLSLKRYNERINKRRKLAKEYMSALENKKNIILPIMKEGNTWSHFPVVLKNEEDRIPLITRIEQSTRCEVGIIVDYSITDLHVYKKYPKATNASSTSKRIINLPMTCYEDYNKQSVVNKIKEII